MAAAQEVKQRHLKVKRTPTIKKHHFCKDTVAHLLASLAEGTPAEERRAHRHCFKQCARRDNRRRTRYRLARAKHRWQQVSPMLRATGKKKLTNASCVRNLEGDLRPASEAAEVRAVYLAQSLWKEPTAEEQAHHKIPTPMRDLRMAPDNPSLDRQFDLTETYAAVKRQAKGKSDKPYGIATEIWQTAAQDETSLHRICTLLNACLDFGDLPEN